ncbi:hypothetical protein EIP86_001392 [Pleurotus ostreatoroseus]|nr:hypothetical protein EIP86_001392 [Pleurotus ostreatoroseus]
MDVPSSSASPPVPPRLPTLYPRPPSLPHQLQSLSATTANYDLDHVAPRYPMGDDFPLPHGHGHGQTCVPSLIPPGIDPAHVDMRTFYPYAAFFGYQPNEVKHRKRTTRQQLRVLEDVYKGDTKPNAGLRKRLAEELGMTPRGVQVWFQNRRAKTKSQNRKAEAMAGGVAPGGNNIDNNKSNGNSDGNVSAKPVEGVTNGKSASEPIDLTEPSANVNMDVKTGEKCHSPGRSADTQEASTEAGPGISLTVDAAPEWSSTSASTSPDPNSSTPSNSNGSPNTNAQSPAVPQSPAFPLPSSFPPSTFLSPQAMTHALAARRPSLPVLSFSGPGSTSPSLNGGRSASGGNGGVYRTPSGFDPTQRRNSIDVSRRMLGGHPYAHLAQNTNAVLYPAVGSPDPPSAWDQNQSPNPSGVPPRVGRQGVRHGSMPHVFQSAGLDARAHAHAHGRHGQFLSPQMAARRPGFPTRLSMPSSSPQPPPALMLNRRYASFSLAPPPPSASSSPPAAFGLYEFPGAEQQQAQQNQNQSQNQNQGQNQSQNLVHMRRRRQASPGGRSPPPPIAQFVNNHGANAGIGAMEMYVPARPVAELIPGPLPDASFSFGMPATDAYVSSNSRSGSGSGSQEGDNAGSRDGSSAGSPSPTTSSATLHAAPALGMGLGPGLGLMLRGAEEEADDESASAASSSYAWSRYGSFASSVGSSETSWTSAGGSEQGVGVGANGGAGGAEKEEYTDNRRPSVFLPQIFSGLEVGNDASNNTSGNDVGNSGGDGQHQEGAGAAEGTTPQPSRAEGADSPGSGSSGGSSATMTAPGEVQMQRRASVDVPVFEGEGWQDAGVYAPAPTGYDAFMRQGHGDVQDADMSGELPLLYQKYTVPGVGEEHVSPHPPSQAPAFFTDYTAQAATEGFGQPSPPESFAAQPSPNAFAHSSSPESFSQSNTHHHTHQHAHQHQSPSEAFVSVPVQQPSPPAFAAAQQTPPEGYGAGFGAVYAQGGGYEMPVEYAPAAYGAWGVPVYSSGAIELDRMCVPSALTMETIGEYALYGGQ